MADWSQRLADLKVYEYSEEGSSLDKNTIVFTDTKDALAQLKETIQPYLFAVQLINTERIDLVDDPLLSMQQVEFMNDFAIRSEILSE